MPSNCFCYVGEAGVGGEPVDPEELLLPQRKKTTSFKITNVFLSRPPSNDGDESNEDCEDMEDSHTEVGRAYSIMVVFSMCVFVRQIRMPQFVKGGSGSCSVVCYMA